MAARNFFVPGSHAFNSNGLAIPGATATLYTTGTTTPAAFYSDSGLSVSLGSTITANGIGRFPTAYGSDAIAYRLILKDAAGAELDGGDIDPFYFGQQIIDLIAPGISPEAYGAAADGTTDDHAAFVLALAAISAAGGGKLLLTPGKTYKLGSQLQVDVDNLVIDARGATLTAAFTTAQGIIYIPPGTDNVQIIGLHFRLTGGDADPWHYNVYGTNCRLTDCILEKDDNTAGYQGYIQYGADGFVMEGGRLIGSNGWFVEATNVLFDGVKFKGKTDGTSDDAVAIKATNGVTERVNILGCDFDGFVAFCSIGSEIGTAAANDATYSKIVRAITIDGCTGTNCVYGLYVKPCANDALDYRDGTVRGVTFDNCTLTDPLGTRLQSFVYITAGRGARIYNVTGKNNTVIGRCKTGASNLFGEYIYVRNDGVGTAAPVISGIDVQVAILDPFNGVASGGASPGSPFSTAVDIEKASAGVGTVSDITLDVTANGTLTNGIGIGAGLSGAIFVRRFHATNLDNDGSAAFAGINSASDYSLGPDISMSVAAGSLGVQYAGAGVRTPQLAKQLTALSVIGNGTNAQADATAIAAASDGHVLRRSGTTVGFGTVATAGIADDAVTYDKLQNVSATSRFLGRITASAGNAEELTGTQAATLIDAATASLQGVMSAQDKTRMDALFTVYRSLLDCSGSITAAQAAATYGMGQGDPLAVSGTGTLYPLNSIHIAAADYPAVGTLNPKLRIRVNIECNDVAPGVTFTVGLHPITRPGTSGGAGVCIYTIGSAVASSTIAVATPAADSSTAAVTAADFSLPADGRYVIGVVTSGGALAASSHVHISAVLQMRYA